MTSATLPSSFVTSGSSATIAGFEDIHLSDWLKTQKKDKKEVVLVHAGTTCKVYEKADARGILYVADPESKSKTVLKALAKQNRLFSVEIPSTDMAETTVASPEWVPQAWSEADIEDFLEKRKARLGRVEGRGDAITLDTANKVWADAGGCCMFKGCGADMSVVPLYNKGARIAYLAHIIASDPDGPRGTKGQSHALSNHPENIMLMCDAHHRLIDVFARESFDASRLQEMRREHALKVRSYRAAMRFPEAQVMTLFADLANVPTHFSDSEFMETLLAEEFSMHSEVKRHLTYKNRDDRTGEGFWENYLREMELPILTLVQELGKSSPSSPDALAIFPLHHTPTLVLAGRIIGEARKVQVFQRSRKRSSWQWNTDTAAHPVGTFKVSGLSETSADDVLMTVELTAKIDQNALPGSLFETVKKNSMPRIQITMDQPSGECIQRKEDLVQVVDLLRSSINFIQDKMKTKRIHLIAVCPASVTFSIGQLLQAGHHAIVTLYDRPNADNPFREAFTINGYSVIPPSGSTQHPISIR